MDKRLIYPQYNINGNRDVFSIIEDKRWLQKQASSKNVYHPQIQKYIDSAKPIENLIQVLLTALGAHEYWGQNVNGDRFYEKALKNSDENYGYKTFLTNANYFTHHVNKDPALAKGKVLEAVWNDKAKRVELVVGINPALDSDAAKMLDNGEELCFSMGARLPYDVCTVCGNKAKTRAEYCDHLRYQMNQIDPKTGILVGAVNPFPKFFDISRVLIPADKTAYMWEKIAHTKNNPLSKVGSAEIAEKGISFYAKNADNNIEKVAGVNKSAEITKRIPVTVNPIAVKKLKTALSQVKCALDQSAPTIPMEVFRGASSINQCIASMAFLGMVPTSSERNSLVDLFTGKDGAEQDAKASPDDVNIKIIQALQPYMAQRSFYRPILMMRLTSGIPKVAAMQQQRKDKGDDLVGKILAAAGLGAAGAAILSSKMGGVASGFISRYPVLAGAMAALLFKMVQTAKQQVRTGNFTVADSSQGLYNNDWQRRFIEMQNRPVTVIKTGAVEKFNDLVSPITNLIMTVDLEKSAEEEKIWDHSADLFIQQINSPEYKKIVKSASDISSKYNESVDDFATELADIKIMKMILGYTK